MRFAVLLLPFLLLGISPPACAQQAKDKIIQNEDAANSDAEQESGWIMNRALPFKDGQTLRYYDPDGTYVGYAERHRLTIYFYDDKGFPVGKAKRLSQAKTRYYAPDGTTLGDRMHKKMTLANTSHDKGFIQPYLGETPLNKQ
jgi:hypothetical protein